MTSKCKTCGRDKLVHTEWDFDKAICEKFQPEDESPFVNPDGEIDGLDFEKQKKGCGTSLNIYVGTDVYQRWCGVKGDLCPSCSNQSPEKPVSGENPRTESKDKPVDTTNRNEAGTQSPQLRIANSQADRKIWKEINEGTSTLSDKILEGLTRRELRGRILLNARDVKEFIRRLKKKWFYCSGKNATAVLKSDIDKLAGSKLLEGGKKDEKI